jgi:hypothetical protein
MTYPEVDLISTSVKDSIKDFPDPRVPGEPKWSIGKWVKHLKSIENLNFISIEKGGYPSTYVHWMDITKSQRDFLETIDSTDYHSFFNMYTFTHDDDCIMFKLKGA